MSIQQSIFFVFYVLIFLERIPSTFSNSKNYSPFKTRYEDLLCKFMVILYVLILTVAFSNIFISKYFSFKLVLPGLFVWLLGVWYRRASIRALGRNWSIYRTCGNVKKVTTVGPYEYARHPYYSASIVELIGYALIFGSLPAFTLVTVLYLPLVFIRAKFEEKCLAEKFKNYIDYQRSTPFIFSIVRFINTARLTNSIKQLYKVSQAYGVRQILRIVIMNKAVKRYFRNYIISQCIACLNKVGFVDEMLTEKRVDIISFSQEKKLEFRILRLICDYLYVVRIFNKRTLAYSLTPYGRSLFTISRGVFDFIHAYAPIFENLDVLILKQKKYGVDIKRRGEFVGRASAELAELFPFPVARDLLQKHNLKSILDLGSGSGDFLIGFCRLTNANGFGVDLSAEAVSYANRKALDKHLNNRIKFIMGDILKLDSIRSVCGDVDVITCMFILHEFLGGESNQILKILESIKKAFPDKPLLICELTKCSLGHLFDYPTGVAEHHLFHYLSNQGLGTIGQWKKIFNQAGYKIIDEVRLNLAEQSIFLLRGEPNVVA